VNNQLLGCIFDASTSTTTAFASLGLGTQLVYSVAVYNVNDRCYIALLTKQNESYYMRLAVAADNGSGYAFTLSSSTITLSNPASKVQWILDGSGNPYIVTDMQETLEIYSADLDSLSLALHDSVTNLAGSTNSTFLYWAVRSDGLYAIQGYNSTDIATYKVNVASLTFAGSGVHTSISSKFSVAHGCSTCQDYLAFCGSNTSSQATVALYGIASDGTLSYASSAQVGSATDAYYCERCCCTSDNHLLVGTNSGLYSLDTSTLAVVASNTSMTNNAWINVCWCCDNTGNYCAATDNVHATYIFEESGSNLQEVVQL
jgi:hypothetical protein